MECNRKSRAAYDQARGLRRGRRRAHTVRSGAGGLCRAADVRLRRPGPVLTRLAIAAGRGAGAARLLLLGRLDVDVGVLEALGEEYLLRAISMSTCPHSF